MTDDQPDITDPKTFVLYAVIMVIFGIIIGIGFYITFAGLNLSLFKGLEVLFVLFMAGFLIAYLYRKIPYMVQEITGLIEEKLEDKEK